MMTREEAIEYNKNLREYMRITDTESEFKFLKENYEALDIAIKALEQEPILDKIRTEIQEYADNKAEPMEMRAYYHCLQIIDKYKSESEDKE